MLKVKSNDNNLRFLQSLLLNESKYAIKKSIDFNDFLEFKKFLRTNLPQNSEYVRERSVRFISNRFFVNNKLSQLTTEIWKFFLSDDLLDEAIKYQYIKIEPLFRSFLVQYILIPNKVILRKEEINDFIYKLYGKENKTLKTRLIEALKKFNFITQRKINDDYYDIPLIHISKQMFFILLHYLFSKIPCTITLNDILKNDFWICLGIKSENDVKSLLKEANVKGLIAKYIKSDQLEQITTKYSYDEILKDKVYFD